VERGRRPPLPPAPKGEEAKVGDGTDRPYAHPYYWAAFVLVGDFN
jgi:CHAT domain-containing protein